MSLIYMLDTNISSAAIRGHAAVNAKLGALPQEAWCISAVTVSEHHYGLAKKPQAHRLANLVNEFLLVAQAMPWDSAAARCHGQLRADSERGGMPLHILDEMIAGHALALGLILVTDNERHFRRVGGLKIENWIRN